MGITTLFELKLCAIFSRIANFGSMTLDNAKLSPREKDTNEDFVTRLEIGTESITKSSHGFRTPPFPLSLWNLEAMMSPKKYVWDMFASHYARSDGAREHRLMVITL